MKSNRFYPLSILRVSKRGEFKGLKRAKQLNSNDEDIRLLADDWHQLLLKYQKVIEIIVKQHFRKGYFRGQQIEDIIQNINLKLLESRLERISKQYNGSVLFATYFSRIIANLCIEEHRRLKKWQFFSISEHLLLTDDHMDIALNIAVECKRLERILWLTGRSRNKLEVCLKLIFKLPLDRRALDTYCPKLTDRHKKALLGVFAQPVHKLTETEIYQRINPVFNYCENKLSTPDALRKWVNVKLNEMLALLNGEPPNRKNYTKDTLGILLEHYYRHQ